MRKKLDTRFPAARIKKIMQTDEDVGKIAMAVPLLVSKALELFLQDLCDRTYDITLKKGAKTLNSLHLKQCVRSFNVFDFLRDIVNGVPDLGGSDAAVEDRSAVKRKIADDEDNTSDDERKRGRLQETGLTSSGRGRGRGMARGRGHGRGNRTGERESSSYHVKFEDDLGISLQTNFSPEIDLESVENGAHVENLIHEMKNVKTAQCSIRDFDLNVCLNEDGESTYIASRSSASTPTNPFLDIKPSTKHILDIKPEDYPGWSLTDMERLAMNPIQFANISTGIYEEEDDYDEE